GAGGHGGEQEGDSGSHDAETGAHRPIQPRAARARNRARTARAAYAPAPMRRPLRLLSALLLPALLLLAVAACAEPPAPAPPAVLLISLDGTRPADVAELPLFRRIAAQGAAADGLEPVFPSNTFPNHVTLVTGVEPDRHGIVNNVFRDPARGVFRYANDPTWLEAPPLWSLLAARGI